MATMNPARAVVTNSRDLPLFLAAAAVVLTILTLSSSALAQTPTEPEAEVADEGEESRLQPPTPSTEVILNIDPKEILSIDEKEQVFVVDVLLEATWKDHRIPPCRSPDDRPVVYQGEGVTEMFKANIWWPGFNVTDGQGPRSIRARSLTLGCDGQVEYAERFVARVSQDFENLNDFPFDEHDLRFTVTPFAEVNESSVNLKLEEKTAESTAARRVVEKWDSDEWTFELEDQDQPIGSSLTTIIRIERKHGWYIWNIVVPLIMIVGLSSTVFWVQPDRLPERLGISTTGLLTVVAFDFLTSDNLPKLAFTTRLDAFYNWSYASVFSTVVVSVLVSVSWPWIVPHRGTIDTVSRVAFPVIYVTVVGLTLYGVFSPGERDDGTQADLRADVIIEAEVPGGELDQSDSDFEEAFGFRFSDIGDRDVEIDLSPGFRLDAAIDSTDPVDVYQFCGVEGDEISVTMQSTDPDSGLDPWLVLYTTDQQFVAADDDSAGDLNSLLQIQVPTDDPPTDDPPERPLKEVCYYLLALDLAGEQTGTYRLQRQS